jgi:hypothetical protein
VIHKIITFVTKHHMWLLGIAIVLMAYAAANRLLPEYRELVVGADTKSAAVDLLTFHRMTNTWFAGDGRIGIRNLVYPPASHVLLWPLVGWMDFATARWLWAVSISVAIVALIVIFGREIAARTPLQWAFVALLVLSMKPVGQTVGNGQISLHVLATVVLASLILGREARGVWRDVLGAACMLFALVKPNVSAPFFWIALFAPRRYWPALSVVVGYGLLTGFALLFRDHSTGHLASTWVATSANTASKFGQGNLSMWLSMLGLQKLIPAATIATLGAVGVWLYRYRKTDVWLRIGLTAVFTRLWTYHYFYDDILLLPTMISLLRVAKDERWGDADRVLAGGMFFLLMLNSVALNPLQTIMPLAPFFRVTALVVLGYLTHKSLRIGPEAAVEEAQPAAGDREPVTL